MYMLSNKFLGKFFTITFLILQGSDASRFQLSMINRQSYTSAVAGILSATNLEKKILLSKFCSEVDTTATNAKNKVCTKKI